MMLLKNLQWLPTTQEDFLAVLILVKVFHDLAAAVFPSSFKHSIIQSNRAFHELLVSYLLHVAMLFLSFGKLSPPSLPRNISACLNLTQLSGRGSAPSSGERGMPGLLLHHPRLKLDMILPMNSCQPSSFFVYL